MEAITWSRRGDKTCKRVQQAHRLSHPNWRVALPTSTLMQLWLRLRFVEDRSCRSYKRCFNQVAFAEPKGEDRSYVPCYFCNGGRSIMQLFNCLHCRTIWTEESNNWIYTQKATCPFCNRTHKIHISMQDGKLIGATSIGSNTTNTTNPEVA